MNIGFDAKRAFMNQSGLGQYSRNLIRGLLQFYPENRYTLFTPKQKISFLEKNHACNIVTPTHQIDRLFASWWRYSSLKGEKAFRDLQVYHGLSAELPRGIKSFRMKKVVTIHDLIFEHYPSYYPSIDRFFYRQKTKYACEASDVIICASEQTKQDLCNMYHVTENKIKVVYQSLQEEIIREENIDIHRPYLVYVSSFNARKNHSRLLQAFALSGLPKALDLVLIGRSNKESDKLKHEAVSLKIEDKVRWIHHADDGMVYNYLKQAKGIVYPSEYEGFGIPILEGFRAGVPVLTSNVSSMKEVGQDASIFVDPSDIDSIKEGLIKLVNDDTQNAHLITRGKELLLTTFSYKQFVQKTYQEYL